MATRWLGHWVPNRRGFVNGDYANVAQVLKALGGDCGFWLLDSNTCHFRVFGIVPPDYAAQDIVVRWNWTIDAAGAGNVNLTSAFRRFIIGVNPAVPESPQRGPGAVAAPASGILRSDSVVYTNAQTGPTFPVSGGLQARDRFYLDLLRTGGTTIPGQALVLGIQATWDE